LQDKVLGDTYFRGDAFRQKLDQMEAEMMSMVGNRGRQSLSALHLQQMTAEYAYVLHLCHVTGLA
jgi:hypothetical protein